MSDLISRQAILSYIDRIMHQGTGKKKSFEFIRKYVEKMPSAQTNLDRIYAELSKAYNVPGLPEEAIGIIGDLMVSLDEPSAQPEPHYDEWCDDCKEYDKERHCCPRWNKVIRETLKDVQPEEDCDTCKHGYFGDDKCNNCRVRYPSHYERRTDEDD